MHNAHDHAHDDTHVDGPRYTDDKRVTGCAGTCGSLCAGTDRDACGESVHPDTEDTPKGDDLDGYCPTCGRYAGGITYGDGWAMCAECMDRHRPYEDVPEDVLLDGDDSWEGRYVLSDGRYLECWICSGFDPEYWEEDVTGSVYYDIFDNADDEDPSDGGDFGFGTESTFGDFAGFVEAAHGVWIVSKVVDI